MSIRSKATAQTRERLLDAALTLFSQRGYAATGIRDILQTAGVTQPTLYHHFADKASVLQSLIERHYGESQHQLEEIIAGEATAKGRLLAFVVSSFQHCLVDPRVPRLMFQTYFGPTVPEIDGVLDKLTEKRFRLVVGIMEHGMRSGELAESNAEFLALAFCSMVDQPLNLFSRKSRPKRYLTPELAHSIVRLFLSGAVAK
ncbi:MAG: TetR/AcrR family transcriptional regulator [Pirellula sp.]|jgi:AcrR family transcriptional regulator|nr:TetR/AcrR family transcriptional regulator [Pirellula sp.]